MDRDHLPAAAERIERIAASDRWIPEILSLKLALDNSRLEQTLNTPAIATLLLMEAQLDWINGNGGLAWADARTRESSGILYDWAEARDSRRRSSPIPTTARRWSSRSTSTSRSTPPGSPPSCAPTASSTPSRTASSAATSCGSPPYVAIEPDDVRALTRSIDWVVEHL